MRWLVLCWLSTYAWRSELLKPASYVVNKGGGTIGRLQVVKLSEKSVRSRPSDMTG